MSVIDSYLPEDHDDEIVPQEPQELKDTLAANDKVAEANMNEVFDDFVKKQHEKNEQPEEVESGKEDEDDNDDDDEDDLEEEEINDANLLDIEEIPDEKEAEQQLPDENATEHNTET